MTDQIEMAELHGQPVIKLQTPDGAVALVSQFGAQVISWTPAGGEERLYLSPSAILDGKTPIRGGSPVCFPQFADLGPLPKHGFARTRPWEVVDTRAAKDYTLVTLRLVDDADTRALWPHAFAAEISISISGDRLDIELGVDNTGDTPFSFTAALHTYLKVREVEALCVEGLRGLEYSDTADGSTHKLDTGDALVIESETDRIYFGVPATLRVREDHRAVAIHTENFPDAVIWNPWVDKCASFADMPADGFRRMLCVEAAAVRKPVELQPQGNWWGRQSLIAI